MNNKLLQCHWRIAYVVWLGKPDLWPYMLEPPSDGDLLVRRIDELHARCWCVTSPRPAPPMRTNRWRAELASAWCPMGKAGAYFTTLKNMNKMAPVSMTCPFSSFYLLRYGPESHHTMDLPPFLAYIPAFLCRPPCVTPRKKRWRRRGKRGGVLVRFKAYLASDGGCRVSAGLLLGVGGRWLRPVFPGSSMISRSVLSAVPSPVRVQGCIRFTVARVVWILRYFASWDAWCCRSVWITLFVWLWLMLDL